MTLPRAIFLTLDLPRTGPAESLAELIDELRRQFVYVAPVLLGLVFAASGIALLCAACPYVRPPSGEGLQHAPRRNGS